MLVKLYEKLRILNLLLKHIKNVYVLFSFGENILGESGPDIKKYY